MQKEIIFSTHMHVKISMHCSFMSAINLCKWSFYTYFIDVKIITPKQSFQTGLHFRSPRKYIT